MDAFFDLDHHDHEPQKDILSSLFPSALSSMQQGHMQQQASFHPSSAGASGSQTSDASPATNLQNQLNMNMFNNMMQIQSAGDSLVGQSSQGAGPSNPQFNAQTVFEQFKIAQLQQLQQLQNQIFQQQIALISGQSSFLPASPSRSDVLSNALSMSPVKDSNSSQTDAVSPYSGLPTPGPSSELRPRDGAMDFVSPMILNTNSFIDSPVSPQSSNSNDHSFSQSHQSTDSQNQPQHYNSAPPQMAFQIQSTLSSHTTSPAFSGDDRSHSGTLSNVSVIPSGELNLSPIASPWFGPINHKRHPQSSTDAGINLRSATFQHQNNLPSSSRTKRPSVSDVTERSSSNIDPKSSSFETGEPLRKKHNPNSPSTMRGYDQPPPQQHSQPNQMSIVNQPSASPVISPMSPFINGLNTNSFTGSMSSSAPRRKAYRDRISKSLNNTPALRGQRSRVGSITHAQGNAINTNNPASASTGSMQLTMSPHVFTTSGSMSSKPATPSASVIETGIPIASFDTPSPVDLDLSMPPPAPPDHFGTTSNATGSNSGSGLDPNPNFQPILDEMSFAGIHGGGPLLPATPASIMNLGRTIGTSTGSAKTVSSHSQAIQLSHQQSSDGRHQTNSSSRDRNSEKPGDKEKEASGKSRGNQIGNSTSIAVSRPRRAAAGGNSGISPALKAILPANPSESGASSLHSATALTRIDSQNQQPPRKTSHKAAEQKRRDSLKTTFDDLRTLLPPIPLPSEMDEFGSGGIIPGIPGAWPPRSSSGLPGSLPPRGPPKTGSEGPNKGVSKLQLLICGNEYIRVLKSRVERRDEEIGQLRKGVSKLRALLKEAKISDSRNDGDVEMIDIEHGFDLDLDLERDLDAVELQVRDEGGGGGFGIGTSGINAGVGLLRSVGELEEEDDND